MIHSYIFYWLFLPTIRSHTLHNSCSNRHSLTQNGIFYGLLLLHIHLLFRPRTPVIGTCFPLYNHHRRHYLHWPESTILPLVAVSNNCMLPFGPVSKDVNKVNVTLPSVTKLVNVPEKI